VRYHAESLKTFGNLILLFTHSLTVSLYSASHSRVALENVDLQKEQKRNTFACLTCNEMQFLLGIRKKEVDNTIR
jgi:hypothetical protein